MTVHDHRITVSRAGRRSLRHEWDVLRVIAGTEFKLKYAGSALGYVWSVAKPLGLFAVLWVVFGRFFKLGTTFDQYPLYLLIGIVLWTFFNDAATLGMWSLVSRSSILRKLSFPRLIIPLSATTVALLTFGVNLVALSAFIGISQAAPRWGWFLIPLLLAELYAFTIGVALVLATLFVRFRDVAQVWELVAQLMFYASPIIYPLGFLPPWARSVAMLSPFTQVMQDIRIIVIDRSPPGAILTAPDVLSTAGRLFPIAIAGLVLAFGLWLFRRQEPWFAEQA
jgi:ABC-2 type transport system permease protein